MIRTLTTAEMKQRIGKPAGNLIDLRPSDAYNGWPLPGEPRGGHLPGATNLPLQWMDFIDWPDIVAQKELDPGVGLVVYGGGAKEIEAAVALERIGFKNVSAYPHFATEWISNEVLPLDRLLRYTALAPPRWLRDALGSRSGLVVCHCHYRNPQDYADGHIPGAIALDTLRLEAPETWNRREPPELRETLAALGITRRTTVVLYGRDSVAEADDPFPGSSAGQLAAMRCAFILLYCGVEDVRVLNGGFGAWTRAGFEVTSKPTSPTPAQDFGGRLPAHPEFAVDAPEARELIRSSEGALVDIRSRAEFEGRVSGYNYIHRAGRIPGAVFAGSGSDAYHVEMYRNLDLTTREADAIARDWRKAGLRPDQRLAFFCGTGWRASEAFFCAWTMGWSRPAVYDGGWFEWSNDAHNSTEITVPHREERSVQID